MGESIVKKEILNNDGELIRLELEVPFVPSGRIVITLSNLVLTRDNGDAEVVIHQHYCSMKKGLKGNHDEEDFHDIPWKSIGICLDPGKDIILVGLQNQPWVVKFTHTGKEIELPSQEHIKSASKK